MTAASTGAGASGEVVSARPRKPGPVHSDRRLGERHLHQYKRHWCWRRYSSLCQLSHAPERRRAFGRHIRNAPPATGGTITVNAEQVALNSQAVITADTNGIAPAGTIDINTGSLAINSGGQIRSSSGDATEPLRALALSPTAAPTLTGGTITVQGQTGAGSQADSVTIDGAGSGIFTQSTGNRPGGDINILTSGSVTMTNGASISASSTGAGNAGNIQINAGNLLAMTNSTVTTEANQASGGAIKITTTPAARCSSPIA